MIEVIVLLDGEVAATITQDATGRYELTYEDGWREHPQGYPISLSMPLAARIHSDEVVRSYVAGLLPDREGTLTQWGRRYGVSPRNPLALLQHVGEDCAGAIQIVPPSEVDRVLASPGEIEWLSEAQVEEELSRLRAGAAPSASRGFGQFSLAGAQSKTALFQRGGDWGRPKGLAPTSHILKPPLNDYRDFVENEHLSLCLAGAVGLAVARSTVLYFGEEMAIVIERYDRIHTAAGLERRHQEDVCQALGIHPVQKYESDGGPGVGRIVHLLRSHASRASEAVQAILDAILFNLLIGGTDAHAKNFSLLLGPIGFVDLAPLYDLATIAPYPDQCDWYDVRSAMRIGKEYYVRKMGPRHLERLAEEIGYTTAAVRSTGDYIIEEMAHRLPVVRDQAVADGLAEDVVDRWVAAVKAHAAQVAGQVFKKP